MYEGKLWRVDHVGLWVLRLHVYKTMDDIIYFALCTSFAIYVDTHACIQSPSNGKIWA